MPCKNGAKISHWHFKKESSQCQDGHVCKGPENDGV